MTKWVYSYDQVNDLERGFGIIITNRMLAVCFWKWGFSYEKKPASQQEASK